MVRKMETAASRLPQACSDQAFFLDDLTAAFFVVLRLVADFLGASAALAVLAAFFFAFFLGGPAAARAANKSSASWKVSSSTAVPFGSDAFVSPSVTYGP